MASLARTMRSVRQGVGDEVRFVSAAVDTKTGGQNDTGNESEERGDNIGDGQDDSNSEAFLERSSNAPENDNHVDDRDEHGIVNFARVAGKGLGNDIAYQRQSEEGEEELGATEGKLRKLCHFVDL